MERRLRVLYYLVRRHYELYGELRGRKKLQKLLFLAEHLDPDTGTPTPSTGATGYTFIIWVSGPLSREVYDDIRRLKDEKLIVERVVSGEHTPRYRGLNLLLYDDDGYPKHLYIYRPVARRLPLPRRRPPDPDPEAKERIEHVLLRYGRMEPWELEKLTLRLLGLTREEKIEHIDTPIDEYLETRGALGGRKPPHTRRHTLHRPTA